METYRSVAVPVELVDMPRYPNNVFTPWWRRGVDDAMVKVDNWIDLGHDLLVHQVETYRSLRRSGISLDAVCDMAWSQVKELDGVGVRRAARLCWIYEKHGFTPRWKDDMLSRAEYFREYERGRRIG